MQYDPYSEERAKPSEELAKQIYINYGIDISLASDLGGSYNLNLHTKDVVVRVYQPYVSAERLLGIQNVRQYLSNNGIPCSQIIPTISGETIFSFENRVVEVEQFVEKIDKMDTFERVKIGLSWLGRIHSLLSNIVVSDAVKKSPVANHVQPKNALLWTLRGTDFIRKMNPTPNQIDFINDAENREGIGVD